MLVHLLILPLAGGSGSQARRGTFNLSQSAAIRLSVALPGRDRIGSSRKNARERMVEDRDSRKAPGTVLFGSEMLVPDPFPIKKDMVLSHNQAYCFNGSRIE